MAHGDSPQRATPAGKNEAGGAAVSRRLFERCPQRRSTLYAESRFARYSAKDSALWMACCLPLGSLGSISVGSGSRVASPPPKPLPPSPMVIFDMCILDIAGTGAMKAEAEEARTATARKRNMFILL